MHVVGGFSILFLVIALAQVIHIWTFMPVSGFSRPIMNHLAINQGQK
jgi:hypothetical protein